MCEKIKQFRNDTHSMLVRQAVGYLEVNFNHPILLADLADYLNVTPAVLSRRFQEETGISVHQYLTNCRLKIAENLIATTDRQVRDIAAYVGIPDNNYFTKVFKAQYGVTPSEYRKKHRIH